MCACERSVCWRERERERECVCVYLPQRKGVCRRLQLKKEFVSERERETERERERGSKHKKTMK